MASSHDMSRRKVHVQDFKFDVVFHSMPKIKEKDKKFVCTGCDRKFTTHKGLTNHRNVCIHLRKSNDQPVTSEEPKKNKKTR